MEEEVQQTLSKIRQTPVPSGMQFSIRASEQQINELSPPSTETHATHRKRRKVKRKKKLEDLPINFDIPGVTKIVISPLVQKNIECTVGEHVTSENPWKYVPKEAFEDNFELQEGSSEFLPIKQEVLNYPRQELLVGYIPDESKDYDEFYICLTEPAEDAVSEMIERIRKQQEERLQNSIYKTIRPWKSLGSEVDVDLLQDKPNRPLLEVEVESGYPIMKGKCKFRPRLVQNARDGYIEILPGRRVYTNTYKKRIDVAIQVAPSLISNDAQTFYTYPKNTWTQYDYKYEPVTALSPEFEENVKSFAEHKMNALSDMIYVNSYINFYTNDYIDLIKDESSTKIPEVATIKEYRSFIEEKLCKGKEIACLSWHPMWTGTVAVAYSDEAPSTYRKYKPDSDEVNAAIYEGIPVLIWTFKDGLNPTLYLETPREVFVISFCPYDENILVGGCANGQIIVWDLTNRVQSVEQEEVLTSAQQKYRALMRSLMKWMKNTKDPKVVRPTAVSELEYSHGSAVTSIEWFSPFREMSKSGQIHEIPEEEDKKCLQFMTASRDGTILAWDLLAKPSMQTTLYRPQRKLRRLKKRPSALTVNVSPFRILHRVFKPLFKINVFAPNSTRALPLASLSIRDTVPQYVEVNPDPNRKFNLSDRIHYKPVFNRPTHPLMTKLVTGSTEGDMVIVGWDGFEFNAGEVVNKETAKIYNIAKYHDGPVVSLARSKLFSDICLTVGGKVFALWNVDLQGRPVMWRRSKVRYTQGTWNWYRPSIFRLTRSDGCVEMWHLKIRSDRYYQLLQVSGKGVTGTFTHRINMKQNILGIGDATGALRLFYVAHNLINQVEEDTRATFKICERDVDKKLKFTKWQEEWKTKNADFIKAKQERELLIHQEREEQVKREKAQLEEEKERQAKEDADRQAALEKPEPGKFSEWSRRKWMAKEKERMNKVLLDKKALDIEVLEKQQLPLVKQAREEHMKKMKQEQRLNNATRIFEDTVAMLFPEVVQKKPIPPPDPYGGGDPVEVKASHFEEYTQIEETCQEFVNKHEYVYEFSWLRALKAGKERRKVLDSCYTRYTHRNRLMKERKKKLEEVPLTLTIQRPREDRLKKESSTSTTSYSEQSSATEPDVESEVE